MAPRSRRPSTGCSSSTSAGASCSRSSRGIRAEQNEASKAIGAAKQRGEGAEAAIAAMQEVAARGRGLSDELNRVEAELDAALAALPNLPDPDAAARGHRDPRGRRGRGRTGRDHLELAGRCIDMEAAARVSGSRFAYLKGDLVMLELALVRFALERLAATASSR